MSDQLDYLAHLRVESSRFAEALADVGPDVRVPTCPDWGADDLLWHLAELQYFWATIVREKVTDPSSLEEPERPTDRADLRRFYDAASTALQQTLAETPPEATRWTWSVEQTAGFTRRRQAHEALIHRLDAELTAGNRTDMDPALSSDGVDEVLRIMFAGVPPWGHIEPEQGETLRITTTDTSASWLVNLGRLTGTDPEGVFHDEPDVVVAETDSGEDAQASVSGRAADVDCWLWGRPPLGSLERTGDERMLTGFEAIIGQGIS